MKTSLLSILLTSLTIATFGQGLEDNYDLNFDDPFELQHLTIDTVSNPNNLWQVGIPNKPHFASAYSLPNAIVTDTINPYPVNDTSVFIITNIASGGGFENNHTVILSGQYFVDSDSLTDYGTIEFSPDNGITWIDLINDYYYAVYILWQYPKPTLTGSSNGWKDFWVQLAALGPVFNLQDGDTLKYRITFISDGNQTNKDGLMFDDFHFEDWFEGIPQIQNDNLIYVYPNPVTDLLIIQTSKISNKQSLQVIGYDGQIIYSTQSFVGQTLDTRQLDNGIYFLKYADDKYFSIRKFVVNH